MAQKICYGQTLIQGLEPYDDMIWNHALFTCHSRTVHLHSKPTTGMYIILERFWEFKPCDHDLENGNPTQTIPLVMCKTFAGNSNTDGLQNSTLVPGKAPPYQTWSEKVLWNSFRSGAIIFQKFELSQTYRITIQTSCTMLWLLMQLSHQSCFKMFTTRSWYSESLKSQWPKE